MEALEYILARYGQLSDSGDPCALAALTPLVATLRRRDLAKLKRKISRDLLRSEAAWQLYDAAEHALCSLAPEEKLPLKLLLKLFRNKNSCAVRYAKRKLLEGGYSAPQREIVSAFLASVRQDRAQALAYLADNWDDAYAPAVRKLWERYREPECGAVVARHLPEKYVAAHLAALDTAENSLCLCMRLAHRPDFPMDEMRAKYAITDSQYLAILAASGAGCDAAFARRTLYGEVGALVKGSVPAEFREKVDAAADPAALAPATKWFAAVRSVLQSMGRLGMAEEIMEFDRWDEALSRDYRRAADSARAEGMSYIYSGRAAECCWRIFCETLASSLPAEFRVSLPAFSELGASPSPTLFASLTPDDFQPAAENLGNV